MKMVIRKKTEQYWLIIHVTNKVYTGDMEFTMDEFREFLKTNGALNEPMSIHILEDENMHDTCISEEQVPETLDHTADLVEGGVSLLEEANTSFFDNSADLFDMRDIGEEENELDSDRDSEESMVYIATQCTPQSSKAPSPRKRKRGQYLRKESGTSSQKEKREANRIKGIHHRRRNAIYKELLHLKMDTQWEGIVILRSKDKTKIVCAGTDTELEERFFQQEVLVDNLDKIKKKDMHKIDMSSVMLKLSSVGKRMESVLESPDPSPSKVPEIARDMLPGPSQKKDLESIPLKKSDGVSDYQSILTGFTKKKSNICLFKSDKGGEASEEQSGKGKGKGKGKVKGKKSKKD